MASFGQVSGNIDNQYKGTGYYYAPTAAPKRPPVKKAAKKTFLSDVATGAGNFLKGAGAFASKLTPDFIENGIKSGVKFVGNAMNSDLGKKVGDVVMAPPRLVSGTLKAGEKRELEKGNDLRFLPQLSDVQGGIKAAFNPRSEGLDSWGAGFSGPGSVLEQRSQYKELSPEEKAIGFTGELLFPTALDLGGGKLIKATASAVGKPAAKAASAVVKKSPQLTKAVETFKPFFRNPEFGKLAKTAERTSLVKVNQLYKKVQGLAKGLTKEDQAVVGQVVEGLAETADPKLRAIADEVIKMGDDVGRQLVEQGLLPAESVAKYQGKYLPHIWESIKKGEADFSLNDLPGLSERFLKKRTGAGGYMQEFAAPTYAGLASSTKNIEAAKFYKQVAEDFGIKVGEDMSFDDLQRLGDEGMKMADQAGIPKFRGGEQLRGYALPGEIVDYLKRMNIKPEAQGFTKVLEGVYDFWRKGKTLWNPAYHVRNIISNQFLSNMATGKPMVKTVLDWAGAVKNYYGRGNQAFVDAAENIGLIKTKSVGAAFDALLESSGLIDKKIYHKIGDFVKGFQNVNEETSKLSIFKHVVTEESQKLGIPVNEGLQNIDVLSKAMDVAEEAIFSPYRLGPAERDLMKWVIPFYSFSRQAIPFAAKTAINNPERLAKYPRFKSAVEGLSQDLVPEEDRTDWQKGAVQLPEGISKALGSEDPLALDTQYLYPFGSMGEEIDITKGKLPFGLGINPLVTYAGESMAGKEFYFDKEFGQGPLKGFSIEDWLNANPRQADTQKVDHFLRTWAPTLYRSVKGKIVPAYEGRPDYAGRERNLGLALIDSLTGIKLHTLRPEEKKQFDTWDLKTKINEIEKEMYSIVRDKRLSDEERKFYLDKARQAFEEVIADN